MENYFTEQQNKANKSLEETVSQTRNEDRILWDKLITVILGILGFSLTLFSTDLLSSKITTSCSKYLLLSSWTLYVLSLFIVFYLLKKESLFQKEESLRKVLYQMDIYEITDSTTLKVKENKKKEWIALQILHGKRSGPIDHWSKYALDVYEKKKSSLDSYKALNSPEKFYSFHHMKIIKICEKSFYLLTVFATVFLLATVISILIS